MKAILVHEFGGPEVLKLEELPTPRPAAGQVLVRIHAAGVNPYDTYMRNGTYPVKPALPYTPGSDAAGIVEAVGEGVTNIALHARLRCRRHRRSRWRRCDQGEEGRPRLYRKDADWSVCGICAHPREPGSSAPGEDHLRAGSGYLGAVRHRVSRLASVHKSSRWRIPADSRREWRRGHRCRPNGERHGYDGPRHGGHGERPRTGHA